MGSPDTRGVLLIAVENPSVTAGSEITGVIHLVVQETAPAHSLELWLKGKEYTHYAVKQGISTHHYYGNRDVLRWKIPVYVFSEGKVDPGHYNFPFTLPIPKSLPGTFHYKEDSLLKLIREGSITYILTAKVISTEKHISKWKLELRVIQTCYQSIPNEPQERTVDVSTWCCLNRGSVVVKVETDKSYYFHGEQAVTSITVSNRKGELPVTHYRASLLRTIVLRTSHGSTTSSSLVSTLRCPTPVYALYPDDISMSLMLPVTIGDQVTFTLSTQLITCIYEIKAETRLDGCLCGSETPEVKKQVVVSPVYIRAEDRNP